MRDRKTNKVHQKPKPKKVTAGYLERAALHYLGRFSSSEKNLIDVLRRKIRRRNPDSSAPTDEQMQWVHDVVKKCRRYGYVDDDRYARQRAETLIARGKPARMIDMDLRQKGIADEIRAIVINALSEKSEVDLDVRAAAAYVRRRRFGPYRRPNAPPEKAEKELAALARAGFSYEISRRMLALSQNEIEDILIG